MFKVNLKIALRNLRKNFGLTLISVGGLAIALSAFILILLYVNYETSYDRTNPNYKNIYLVGRNLTDYKTDYTPPPLAKLIKENCPEVRFAGKFKPTNLEFAVISDKSKVFISNSLSADYEAAQMFGLSPDHGLQKPVGSETRLFYLNKENTSVLFPGKKDTRPELVAMGSKNSGQTATITGSIVPDPHSNIQFDALIVMNEMGEGEGFGFPNYHTYIQVQPGTDIKALQIKIDKLLKDGMVKEGISSKDADYDKAIVYLDPLSDLHLRPTAGSDSNYKVVMVILVLGFLILLIACINFTNLSIAQANNRAKEVGVKKVLGAYRHMLTLQFISEIVLQCTLAVLFSLVLAELFLPAFNNLFQVPLSIWRRDSELIVFIPLILLGIIVIAGIYPALVLSGYSPAMVLKGNFQTSVQSQWLRKGLLVFQFVIAVVFIAGLFIVNAQLKYMRTADSGFNANQVVYIKNMSIFNDPDVFAPVREKILKTEGVKSVTVANIIPDGSKTGANRYTLAGKETLLDFIDVDFSYFETLGIKIKEGRFFSRDFKTDTASSAILNESAVAKYGIQQPIGKIIRGCDIDYKIVGVIKDFKSQGFENAVQPTIYTMKNPCGNARTSIMIKIDKDHMAAVLATLKTQWPDINKLDGENFRYEFLDELYGKMFKKQELLQSVFLTSSLLTLLIAILGLFALAKFMTASRTKEIAVRKILGANTVQILTLLNGSFLAMAVIANLIAWPFAYIIAEKWLTTFAYRIDLSIVPFGITALITLLLTVITVSLQASKAARKSPVEALKYE